MAQHFDGIDDYITIADDPALSFGDDVDSSGPFSLAFWIKCAMNDADYHYIMSWGTLNASPSASITINGDQHATLPGKIWVQFQDNAGTYASGTINDAISDNDWHHVTLVFDGIWLKAWLDGSLQTNLSLKPTLDTIDVTGMLYLGRYSGSAANYFAGHMAEWGKWDVALSAEQRAALVDGVRPVDVGSRPAWYLPMLASLDEEIEDLMLSNVGTTISEHPPAIIPPGVPLELQTVPATIGGPYKIAAAGTHVADAAVGETFSTGATIGQVNGY